MSSKLLHRTLVFCISGSFFVTALLAIDNASSSDASRSPAQGAPSSSTTSSANVVAKSQRLSQLMGSNVKNAQGEVLGQISDFVVNPTSGAIQFVIISVSDPAQTGKMTAVPWMLAKPGPGFSSVTLNVDKPKLASAQTFDATSWPDFNQASWSQAVYSHYGIRAPLPSGQGGGIPTHDSESGRGSSEDTEKNQNPNDTTTPEGKGTIKKGPDVAPLYQKNSADGKSQP